MTQKIFRALSPLLMFVGTACAGDKLSSPVASPLTAQDYFGKTLLDGLSAQSLAAINEALSKIQESRALIWQALTAGLPQEGLCYATKKFEQLCPTPRLVAIDQDNAATHQEFMFKRLNEEQAVNRDLQQQLQQKDEQIQQLQQQRAADNAHHDAELKGKSQELAAAASEIEKLKAVVSDTQEKLAATRKKLSEQETENRKLQDDNRELQMQLQQDRKSHLAEVQSLTQTIQKQTEINERLSQKLIQLFEHTEKQ